MSSSSILSVITFVYGLASIFFIIAWIFSKPSVNKMALWTSIIGCAGNFSGILLRWYESHKMGIGYVPLSNMYESLIFFSFVIVLLYLTLIRKKDDNPLFGSVTLPLAFLAMAYASMSPNVSDRIQPLIPALKSNWLIAHVITCFLGYAGFAVAFGISILYLFKQNKSENVMMSFFPNTEILDELMHKMVMFGFLFLSIGIITGAVWANSAWGSYWSWDPKETWSLITWFIYAILLHVKLMRGWHGRRIAYISIIGFIAVLFTYFGVNYLLSGLHSYAQ